MVGRLHFLLRWSLIGGRWYVIPQLAIYHLYATYILPIGRLYITYHLLREPETAIDDFYNLQPGFQGKFPELRSGQQKTPGYCWWLKSCTSWYGKYPVIYRVSYIPGGAGFQPSTVSRLIVGVSQFLFTPFFFVTVASQVSFEDEQRGDVPVMNVRFVGWWGLWKDCKNVIPYAYIRCIYLIGSMGLVYLLTFTIKINRM